MWGAHPVGFALHLKVFVTSPFEQAGHHGGVNVFGFNGGHQGLTGGIVVMLRLAHVMSLAFWLKCARTRPARGKWRAQDRQSYRLGKCIRAIPARRLRVRRYLSDCGDEHAPRWRIVSEGRTISSWVETVARQPLICQWIGRAAGRLKCPPCEHHSSFQF